jgi:hypothetical protein
MSCVSRFFGILASNIFFVALLAMTVAVFTNSTATPQYPCTQTPIAQPPGEGP